MPAPTGPQFQRVFHRSDSEIPVHLQAATSRQAFNPESNYHPDVFHVGTEASTSEVRFRTRPYMHEYEIDMSHPSVSPITWGEERTILRSHASIEQLHPDLRNNHSSLANTVQEFNDNMKGQQEGLFESVPANAEQAAKGTILPYRNRVEDKGSISYIVPKSAVGNGVRLVGVTRVPTPYDKV